MPQPPDKGPKKVDRSQIREAAKNQKKSLSPFVIILIVVFGGGGLVIFGCAGWFILNLPQPAQGPGGQAQGRRRGMIRGEGVAAGGLMSALALGQSSRWPTGALPSSAPRKRERCGRLAAAGSNRSRDGSWT